MDFKRILTIALIVAVIATPLNDAVRYLGAFYNLDNVTREAAQAAADKIRTSGTDTRGPGTAAVAYASQRGVVVYGYEQVQGKVTVWTRAPVEGTWAWSPIAAAFARKPFQQWWKSPPLIQSKADAFAM